MGRLSFVFVFYAPLVRVSISNRTKQFILTIWLIPSSTRHSFHETLPLIRTFSIKKVRCTIKEWSLCWKYYLKTNYILETVINPRTCLAYFFSYFSSSSTPFCLEELNSASTFQNIGGNCGNVRLDYTFFDVSLAENPFSKTYIKNLCFIYFIRNVPLSPRGAKVFFYAVQACIGRWLKNYTKNIKKCFGLGLRFAIFWCISRAL